MFFEAYGIPVPNNLRQWIIQRLIVLCDTLRNGAAAGNPAFKKIVDEGHLAYYEKEVLFVQDHFDGWM
ncbi:hypothetical protein D3C72_2404400 [compost metagenome]